MTDSCPIHGQPWKTVPAGVSKTTGRPYNAFKACPVKGCDQRPSRTPRPNGGGSPSLRQPGASQGPSQSDREITMMATCLAFASRLYAGCGQSGVENAKALAREMFSDWKEKAK